MNVATSPVVRAVPETARISPVVALVLAIFAVVWSTSAPRTVRIGPPASDLPVIVVD